MASIIVLLVILGCAAIQFVKGTFIRAFITVIVAVCANIVAFNYYEILTGPLGSFGKMAQPLSFFLLFALTFAVLETVIVYLTRPKIDFGTIAEPIGRIVFGLVLGYIVSGSVLVLLAMAPLPSQYPYERFASATSNPDSANKVLLNADGFVTGMVSLISNGSFKGSEEFDPDFLNQLHLDRLDGKENTSSSNSSQNQQTNLEQNRGGRGQRGNQSGQRGGQRGQRGTPPQESSENDNSGGSGVLETITGTGLEDPFN